MDQGLLEFASEVLNPNSFMNLQIMRNNAARKQAAGEPASDSARGFGLNEQAPPILGTNVVNLGAILRH